MRQFPTHPIFRGKLIQFVRRHRANFNPTSTKTWLCYAHFQDLCYESPRELPFLMQFYLQLQHSTNIILTFTLTKNLPGNFPRVQSCGAFRKRAPFLLQILLSLKIVRFRRKCTRLTRKRLTQTEKCESTKDS